MATIVQPAHASSPLDFLSRHNCCLSALLHAWDTLHKTVHPDILDCVGEYFGIALILIATLSNHQVPMCSPLRHADMDGTLTVPVIDFAAMRCASPCYATYPRPAFAFDTLI